MARKGKREAELEDEGLPATPIAEAEAFRIALPAFEGPLDLLLHLIQEHRLDIFDIPIALITTRYLEYLDLMKAMNLDVAAEFLVMAATLAHLKSRLLLPREEIAGQEETEEGEDPREALVRRLLEYQKYRDAGVRLGQRPQLGRDTFGRPFVAPEDPAEIDGARGLAEVSVFKLIELFARLLEAAKIDLRHEIVLDRLSIGDAIHRITERLQGGSRVSFAALFQPLLSPEGAPPERHRVVVTFLAILEMVKLGLLRIFQERPNGEILLSSKEGKTGPIEVEDDYRS